MNKLLPAFVILLFLPLRIYTQTDATGALRRFEQQGTLLQNKYDSVAQTHTDTSELLHNIEIAKNILFQSKPHEAKLLLRETLKQSQRLFFHTGIVTSLSAFGLATAKQGYIDSGMIIVYQALNWYNNYSTQISQDALYDLYAVMGMLYSDKGQYDSAHHCFYNGLLLAEKDTAKNSARLLAAYNNMSIYWVGLKEWEKAAYYINKALPYLEKVKNSISFRRMGVGIYNNMATLKVDYFKQNDSAIYYSRLALQVARGDSFSTGLTLNLLGYIHSNRKEYEKAVSCLKEAYVIWKGMNDFNGLFSSGYALGCVYLDAKQYREAEPYLLEALRNRKQYARNQEYLNVLQHLYSLYQKQESYDKAFYYLAEAYSLRDSLFALQFNQGIQTLEVKYKVSEKDKSLVQKALQISEQKNEISRRNIFITATSIITLLLIALLITLRKNYRANQKNLSNKVTVLERENELGHLNAIIKGEESERKRIAQEIHDGIGGMLAAIKMNISTLQNKTITTEHLTELNGIMDIVEETASEVRRTAQNLMPDLLMEHNLLTAIRIYTDMVYNTNNLHINLQVHSEWPDLDKSFELSLYRILQEIVQNTIKHAAATSLVMQFRITDDEAHIITEDNGKGFDVKHARKGLGLSNIESRIKHLKGEVHIESIKGEGTTFYLIFNISNYKV